MFKSSKKGFTLIEMLIVVAVVGILSSLVLVGIGPVQRKARDARRISDLRQVQTGLELYFSKSGEYPPSSSWADLKTALASAGIGVSNIPNDPTSSKTYSYGANATQDSYVLGATLEDTTNPNLSNDVDGTVNAIDCADPVYCVEL